MRFPSSWRQRLLVALVCLALTSEAGGAASFFLEPELGWKKISGFDDTFRPGFGSGGVIGVHVLPHLALTLHGDFCNAGIQDPASTTLSSAGSFTGDVGVRYVPFGGSPAALQPFLGVGGGLSLVAWQYSDQVGPSSGGRTDGLMGPSLVLEGGLGVRLGGMVAIALGGRQVIPTWSDQTLDNVTVVVDDRPLSHLFVRVSLNAFNRGVVLDADQDGVADRIDRQPYTPANVRHRVNRFGEFLDQDGDDVADWDDQEQTLFQPGWSIDVHGRSIDLDHDGVNDGVDSCRSTPLGETVDRTGCSMDTDGDGVADGPDHCAGTPPGCTTSADGCPRDADQDDVCDDVDQCPNTPKVEVNEQGCPKEITRQEWELIGDHVITSHHVLFDTGSDALVPSSFAVLDSISHILSQYAELRIEVEGHTDERGSPEPNQELSQRRATRVVEYLLASSDSLQPDHFRAVGWGESRPIGRGLAQNRRVQFRVLNPEVLRRLVERRGYLPRDAFPDTNGTTTK